MACKFNEVMWGNQANLEEEVYQRLTSLGGGATSSRGGNQPRQRVAELVHAFLTALQDGHEIFFRHVEAVTQARIDEGALLHELQEELQVLEARTWGYIVESIPQADQVRCLGQVTMTIGAAKDHIAQVYMRHMEMAEDAINLMRRGAAIEDDLNWQRGILHQHEEKA